MTSARYRMKAAAAKIRRSAFHRNPTVSRRLARSLLAAAVLAAVPALSIAADRITGHTFATRSEVIAPHAMAATSQPLATQIALDVMKGGGSAVDAAIAANAALGLMEPTGNGIGGDLFAIVWDPKTQRLYGYNGSGRSPKSLTLAEFQRRGLKDIPATGPLPVSVPGAVDGWFALHDRFGRKPMADNLAPAIRYAREGHPVAEVIAYYWDRSVPKLSQYPGFKEQFTINGHAPRKGEMWKNPNLASTLQKIADGGRDAFYKGEIAHTIGDYFKANGGYLSYQDMADHHGEWVEPVSSNYRGYDVGAATEQPGIAALQILNVLEGYDFSKIPFGSPEHVHLFVEAKKLAFADRALLRRHGIPAGAGAEADLREYAAQRRALISMDKALKEVQPGTPKQLEEGDTIYMTVADADGMMVSLIQSITAAWAAAWRRRDWASSCRTAARCSCCRRTIPTDTHRASAPSRRSFRVHHQGWQAVCQLRRDGRCDATAGHAQIVMNLVDFGMNLQEAGDAPRIQHEGSTEPTGQATAMTDGGEVNLETGFPYETVRALMRKGIASCSQMGRMAVTRRSCAIPRPGFTTGLRRAERMGRRRGTEVYRPPG